MHRIQDPLRRFLSTYGNVEVYEPELVRCVTRPGTYDAAYLPELRQQLAQLIHDGFLHLQEIERITDNAFDSPEELDAWLRELLAAMSD